MEKNPLEILKDLLNSIKDLFTKDFNVTAQVVVSKIKGIVEQWKKDLAKRAVPAFGEERIDVTIYGGHRDLREKFTQFLDLFDKAGDVENQMAVSEKVKGIDDEIRRLEQQKVKIKDEKTRELVGMTAAEVSKEKEELLLWVEKELEKFGASSVKFKNIVFSVLRTIEAGPSSISQKDLLDGINSLLEDYPLLENEKMLVDVLIAGRGEKVVYKEKLEKEKPEGIVPMEKEKRIPEKVWEERRESVNFDTIYGALDWITDIGEKMTRAITWLKNKVRGVFDWIRDSGSAIHETADGIDQLTMALENIYNEYSATATVEGRLASEMRNIESEKEFDGLAKRFGAVMDENLSERETRLRKEKKWKVVMIDKGKQIDKIIVLGPESNTNDVIEQLHREGLGGEITSIQDVTEWQLSDEEIGKRKRGSSKKLAQKELGWWGINFTIEPNEDDLSHVAELIKQEYTEGEMVHEEERGWWKINYTIEPNEIDLEHIAEMIKEGYTEGEMVQIEEEIESSKKLAQERYKMGKDLIKNYDINGFIDFIDEEDDLHLTDKDSEGLYQYATDPRWEDKLEAWEFAIIIRLWSQGKWSVDWEPVMISFGSKKLAEEEKEENLLKKKAGMFYVEKGDEVELIEDWVSWEYESQEFSEGRDVDLPKGLKGVVVFINIQGEFHVSWDNGITTVEMADMETQDAIRKTGKFFKQSD